MGHFEMSIQEDISKLTLWRRRAPKFTTFRINTLVATPSQLVDILNQCLLELSETRTNHGADPTIPIILSHPVLHDVVVMGSWREDHDLPRLSIEVIVDPACGAAVLRGAHVFAPGVLGLLSGAKRGDTVSIYADLNNSCKRGWTQKYDDNERFFVGNGLLLMERRQIFGGSPSNRGVAVLVTNNVSGCPSLPENIIPSGVAIMQNLPSILCGHVLDPQHGERILDMCAAPGNKTTHLAALMQNTGVIIALDRSASRISKLRQLCLDNSVKNVHAFVCNSIKAVTLDNEYALFTDQFNWLPQSGPPFPACFFDRILLDAPCSGVGQRPRLDPIDLQHIASFPPLQKKLLRTAVTLLKPGGILVYSTCSVLVEEDEAIVRWALDNFPCLQLLPVDQRFSSFVPHENSLRSILSPSEMDCVFKFVPSFCGKSNEDVCEKDTIGFFIARFQKKV